MLKFVAFSIGLTLVACAEPDHALRNLLNVGSIEMKVPDGVGKFEVSCLFYEFGQKRSMNLVLDVSPRATVELLWKSEAGKTRVVLSSESNTRSVILPSTFDGDVGMATNMFQPTALGDGWIAGTFYTYAKVVGTSGSISAGPFEKLITERTRRTFVLAYRPKR